ncbi:alpha-D-ribose 1-methylphosphonate 5-triphosphate diphosphatase [Celerinatantimonas yamalensis]|uniref:Alpha-D-ribose 1-methylphosphonate 5-triphosphate diphosphatase n=1 Tax=Celerinatantimonas yamalensis TaxID=559956 RepID=A0ABW9G7T8_9GAMM
MILTNVQLVLADEVMRGTIVVEGGRIQAIDSTESHLPEAIDGEGGFILPGLVELHTDNMEKHFSPRPGVRWPSTAAFKVHDAQMISSGITTVFDAISVGDVIEHSERINNLRIMVNALKSSREHGFCRADHRLHLRCELSHADTLANFEQLFALHRPQLVSVMDHSPGQRQYVDLSAYRRYFQGKYHMSDSEIDAFIIRQSAASERYSSSYRQQICDICHRYAIPLASHDDATDEHIQQALAENIQIAEFPTALSAAKAAHEHGIAVVMGAPNVVRGGSHSGNVAAHELAQQGLLDILSSDYYPASLLDAAFKLADDVSNPYDLPQACALVTCHPAERVGLTDRGRLEVGLNADLIWCHQRAGQVHIHQVLRAGERVF